MEQAVIIIIAAIAMGLQALFKKLKNPDGDPTNRPLPPVRPSPGAPVQLTEADRRYREVQEEVRRRIALRQQLQQQQGRLRMPTPPPVPAPAQPVATYISPVTPAIPPPMPTPEEIASTAEAAATEAAAYALPEISVAAGSIAIPPPVGSLRALLASPTTVRQAWVLREVLDRPLALRSAPCGGHEQWL